MYHASHFFYEAASLMFGYFFHIFSYNAGGPRGLCKTRVNEDAYTVPVKQTGTPVCVPACGTAPGPLLWQLAGPQFERLFPFSTLARFIVKCPFYVTF